MKKVAILEKKVVLCRKKLWFDEEKVVICRKKSPYCRKK